VPASSGSSKLAPICSAKWLTSRPIAFAGTAIANSSPLRRATMPVGGIDVISRLEIARSTRSPIA
jgi:hypothetical protein